VVFGGPPGRLVEHAHAGELELILPVVVRGELERALREKFRYSAPEVDAAVAQLSSKSPKHPRQVEAVTGDPADDVILACAVEAGADVLVTGDRKHLLPLGEHAGVRILTPQAFLAELTTGG
jgi:predicted nucleic acid-binding protein